ncbi:hypothetical protein I204_08097 [Kwoniella mangroviensis CBS 8886]|uniref:uncharacterized protein n=1 Tax=Kwoniella mangroviensis CBS 8507 TaxID=1296122 RepID=UPI00080D004A|nr:uncharacterized protein I203_04543 [Kwoniella mangroviensis CBS 8507]OCF66217.1 hypothetical protein I203_04543 [Kwoniella mangroviensis CBS 8507]OCF71144.1 hypothetical protein I204_08097 [Kwoniella mangroviensis CBS 8886]
MSKAPQMPSEVNILKTKAANKKGPGSLDVETVWPKPEFGPSTTIDNITKEGKTVTEFIVPAGSMFTLGAALPNHTVLKWGAYFPPGTMFPDGVLVPIHARMVSVQPLKTVVPPPAPSEPVCIIM